MTPQPLEDRANDVPRRTVLIVDDERRFTDTYRGFLADEPVDVIIAHSLDEVSDIVRSQRPIDAATIDYSIGVATGNDVANMLRQQYTGILLAGITGGDPASFDESLFAIRERKGIDENAYRGLVRALLSGNPDAYAPRAPVQGQLQEELCALSILLQGYTLGVRVGRGEVLPGFVIPPSYWENRASLLDLSTLDVDPRALTAYLDADPRWGADDELRAFSGLLRDGRGAEVADTVAERAELAVQDIMERLYRE